MDHPADRTDAYPASSDGGRAGGERAVAAAPEVADAARPAPPPGAEDPARKLERLTGRTGPAAPPRPRAPSWRLRAGRATVAAVAALVLAWGGLATASAVATPERARVADVAALAHVDPAGLGGAPLAGRLAAALAAVAEARRTRPGRPPTYDADALALAAADLGRVAAEAPPGSAVGQEAGLARGRLLLHLGRDAEAARALGALVRAGGYRGPEARRLLDWVRTGGPEGGPRGGAG